MVPRAWVGPIIVLFILVVGFITWKALDTFDDSPPANTNPGETTPIETIEPQEVVEGSVSSLETFEVSDIPQETRPLTPKINTKPPDSTKVFKIVDVRLKEKKPFPVYTVTLINRTDDLQVINKVRLEVLDYLQHRPGAEAFLSKPLVNWNLIMPTKTGTFDYPPTNKVVMEPKSVATLELQFSMGTKEDWYNPRDIAVFKFRFSFITELGETAESEVFKM